MALFFTVSSTASPCAASRAALSLCSSLHEVEQIQFFPSFAAPQSNESSNKNDFAFLACRSWWQNLKHRIKEVHVYLLICLEERQCRGGPGGNVRVSFLSPFLCGMTKKWHQNRYSERVRSTV